MTISFVQSRRSTTTDRQFGQIFLMVNEIMKDEENDEDPRRRRKTFLRSYTKYNKQIHASGDEGKFSRPDLFLRRKVGFHPIARDETQAHRSPGKTEKIFWPQHN